MMLLQRLIGVVFGLNLELALRSSGLGVLALLVHDAAGLLAQRLGRMLLAPVGLEIVAIHALDAHARGMADELLLELGVELLDDFLYSHRARLHTFPHVPQCDEDGLINVGGNAAVLVARVEDADGELAAGIDILTVWLRILHGPLSWSTKEWSMYSCLPLRIIASLTMGSPIDLPLSA